jgi:high affinity sulfate transporter 1
MTSIPTLPAISWLRDYRREWLAKDVVGGLAAGAVVIPQAMAYATIANLPVQVGLYTCMVPMVVYALLGGSRTLSVSTTSTVAVLTGSALIAAGVAANSDDPARELATLTLLVGLILLGTRLLRLGSIVDQISEATLTGIKIGVGLTVAAGQLPKLLGISGDPTATNFFENVHVVLKQLDDISVTTLVFSVCVLVLLAVLTRVVPSIPAPLVAVVGSIVLVAVANLDAHGIALVAHVPSGLPLPVAPSKDHVTDLLPSAFAIAIMVFLETVAVARSVRRPSEPEIDTNQELVANALSCSIGAFFRAMPSAGGFSQTAINQNAGAQTQLSELVTVGLAVASALVLGGVLSDLPEATLGCLVMVAVVGLIKPSELVRYWKLSRLEFWVTVVTAAAGLGFGLLVGVLVGVLLTLFLILRELAHVNVTELQPDDRDDLRVAGSHTTPVPGLLVLRYEAPLYSANVRTGHHAVIDAVDAHPGTRVLVLDLTTLGEVPLAVVDEYPQLAQALTERGVEIWAAGLTPRALALARRLPAWQRIDEEGRLFPTSLAAVRTFRQREEDA